MIETPRLDPSRRRRVLLLQLVCVAIVAVILGFLFGARAARAVPLFLLLLTVSLCLVVPWASVLRVALRDRRLQLEGQRLRVLSASSRELVEIDLSQPYRLSCLLETDEWGVYRIAQGHGKARFVVEAGRNSAEFLDAFHKPWPPEPWAPRWVGK